MIKLKQAITVLRTRAIAYGADPEKSGEPNTQWFELLGAQTQVDSSISEIEKDLNGELLARLVVKAASLKEKSFDKKAADQAVKNKQTVNFEQFYKIDLLTACRKACKDYPGLEQPVYLLLCLGWNDALSWAEHEVQDNSKESKNA